MQTVWTSETTSGTEGQRDRGTKGQRDRGTEGRRDGGTEGRRDRDNSITAEPERAQ